MLKKIHQFIIQYCKNTITNNWVSNKKVVHGIDSIVYLNIQLFKTIAYSYDFSKQSVRESVYCLSALGDKLSILIDSKQ